MRRVSDQVRHSDTCGSGCVLLGRGGVHRAALKRMDRMNNNTYGCLSDLITVAIIFIAMFLFVAVVVALEVF
jgi:hypothetical protein